MHIKRVSKQPSSAHARGCNGLGNHMLSIGVVAGKLQLRAVGKAAWTRMGSEVAACL